MSAWIRLIDETSTGKQLSELLLELESERVTARELIVRRVHEEVARHERATTTEVFHGLVQPTETEVTLNGYRFREPRRVDVQAQCQKALEAFDRNGFLLLVGERQVESLDEELLLTPETRVAFVRLLPLVGG